MSTVTRTSALCSLLLAATITVKGQHPGRRDQHDYPQHPQMEEHQAPAHGLTLEFRALYPHTFSDNDRGIPFKLRYTVPFNFP